MSDATYIELPPQPSKRPLFRSWRGILLLIILAAIVVAGWFSWWLSEGKIASSQARVDATVYTVEVAFPTTIEGILVRQGAKVQQGQALAQIDTGEYAASLQKSQLPPVPDTSGQISGRLAVTEQTERQMAVRLAQARAEEARYQDIHQQMVTEHVRAQLHLRSINNSNYGAWEQASRAEAMARSRMEAARAEFERVSKTRAAIDNELNRIRYELARNKNRPQAAAPAQTAPEPPRAPELPNMLYAPVNGEIFAIEAQPGQKVATGQTIFIILPSDQADVRWVQAWFPAKDRKKLKKGQRAQIVVKDLLLPGVVGEIAQEDQIINNKNYVGVQIQVPDQEILEKINPGAEVACQIQTRYLLGEEYF